LLGLGGVFVWGIAVLLCGSRCNPDDLHLPPQAISGCPTGYKERCFFSGAVFGLARAASRSGRGAEKNLRREVGFVGSIAAEAESLVQFKGQRNAKANARLMAAAPELLDAPKELVERDRSEAAESGFTGDEMMWFEEARRVIAKAKGGAA